MTPRERLITALSRKVPDRVPYSLGFNREARRQYQRQTGLEDLLAAFPVRPDHASVSFGSTREDLSRYATYHDALRPGATFNEWGTAYEPGSNPAFDRFVTPLTGPRTLRDIETYPLPDLQADYRHRDLESQVTCIHDAGLAAWAAMEMTIFEPAWQIRGFDELLTGLLTGEEAAALLLDRITELRRFQARRFAEAGADILGVGDDVGMEDRMMLSPALWRAWLKPRLAAVIGAALAVRPGLIVHYHSDGYVEPIVPDLIEIGVNVLNPVQPECMDPVQLKKEYGAYLAFSGTIGTQTTMPFGTPEEVRRVVKDRVATVGCGGGLLIAPTHVLEPDVPWENVVALVEAVAESGS